MPLFLLPLLGFGKSALALFSRPPGSYIACAIGLALGLWWFGQHEYNKGHLAAVTEAANAAVPIMAEQRQISADVVFKFNAVTLADTKATEKRLNEVESHVTPKADAACPVPLGFVRVFNDAAHGSVPPAAAGADDAPSGVTLSEVAKASVQNDGEYDKLADQLTALQDWVRLQQKANP